MKGLLLTITLLTGGITTSMENTRVSIEGYYHRAVEYMGFDNPLESRGVGTHGMYVTEEMEEFMDYQIELVASYDFLTMTQEELVFAKEEIDRLLNQKAIDLGIDNPILGAGFGSSMMYRLTSTDQTEFMYFMHELMNSYDWLEMTETETIEARNIIETKLAEKASELGIEYYGYETNMAAYGNGISNDFRGNCHGSYTGNGYSTGYNSSRRA